MNGRPTEHELTYGVVMESSPGSSAHVGTVHVYCCDKWCGSFNSEADALEWLTTRPDCDTFTLLREPAVAKHSV